MRSSGPWTNGPLSYRYVMRAIRKSRLTWPGTNVPESSSRTRTDEYRTFASGGCKITVLPVPEHPDNKRKNQIVSPTRPRENAGFPGKLAVIARPARRGEPSSHLFIRTSCLICPGPPLLSSPTTMGIGTAPEEVYRWVGRKASRSEHKSGRRAGWGRGVYGRDQSCPKASLLERVGPVSSQKKRDGL